MWDAPRPRPAATCGTGTDCYVNMIIRHGRLGQPPPPLPNLVISSVSESRSGSVSAPSGTYGRPCGVNELFVGTEL